MEHLDLILAVIAGLLAGVVAGLKVIAPLTATKADDRALELAESAEDVVDGVRNVVKK